MGSGPLHADTDSTAGGNAGGETRLRRVEEIAVHELRQFVAMFLYIFVLLGLSTLHESLVLEQHNIGFTHYGFAVINALILAKVMLVAEDLHLGHRLDKRRMIYSIGLKSLLFAAVFICFYIIEETIVGVLDGKTVAESVPSIGSGRGGLMRVAILAIIMTFALTPYFAYTQLARAIGKDKLRAIILNREGDAVGGPSEAPPPKN